MARKKKIQNLNALEHVADVIVDAANGEIGMLDAMVQLQDLRREMEEALEHIDSFKKENVNELAMLASEYPDGFAGYEFEYRNGAARFNFNGIPAIDELNKQLKAEKAKYSAAFGAREKGCAYVTEDGEIIDDFPTVINSAPVLVLKWVGDKNLPF